MVRSKKAGTSMGTFQKLEILWLDLERLRLLWANPKKTVISMVRSQKAGTSMGKS